MSKNPWKQLSNKRIYDNPWIQLEEDQVINPTGGQNQYGKVHFKNLAIAIIPLDEEMNTWLVGQWRYPLDEYSWEIPMGGGLRTVDPLVSAQRELQEETGITAASWELLLKIHTSNSVTDETGFCYVARELTFGSTAFDETEELAIRKLPFDKAVRMVMDGQITDSLSMASILKLDKMLRSS